MSDTKEIIRTKDSSKNNIIWLYGGHQRIIDQTLIRLMHWGSKESNKIRKSLGLKLSDFIIPVLAFPKKPRFKIIEYLLKFENATIIVAGSVGDLKQKDMIDLYKNGEVYWIEPSRSQFYIDMASATDSINHLQYEQEQVKWIEFLNEYFEKVNILL